MLLRLKQVIHIIDYYIYQAHFRKDKKKLKYIKNWDTFFSRNLIKSCPHTREKCRKCGKWLARTGSVYHFLLAKLINQTSFLLLARLFTDYMTCRVDMRHTVWQCSGAALLALSQWSGEQPTGAPWTQGQPLQKHGLTEGQANLEIHTHAHDFSITYTLLWGLPHGNINNNPQYPHVGMTQLGGKVIKQERLFLLDLLKSHFSLSCVCLPCVRTSIESCSSSLTPWSFFNQTQTWTEAGSACARLLPWLKELLM